MDRFVGLICIRTFCGSLGWVTTPERLVRMTASAALVLWVVTSDAFRQPSRATFVIACRTIVIRANSNTPKTNNNTIGAQKANSTAAVPRRRTLHFAKLIFRDMPDPFVNRSTLLELVSVKNSSSQTTRKWLKKNACFHNRIKDSNGPSLNHQCGCHPRLGNTGLSGKRNSSRSATRSN